MTPIRYGFKMTGVARLSRQMLAGVGILLREHWRAVQYLAAVLGATLFLSAQPRRWGRTVRGVFSRQFSSFGVESVPFILILAVLVGISVGVQLWVLAGRLGATQKHCAVP